MSYNPIIPVMQSLPPGGTEPLAKASRVQIFLTHLKQSALASGLKLYSYSEVRRFVLDADQQIIGVEIVTLADSPGAEKKLAAINRKFGSTLTLLSSRRALRLSRMAESITEQFGRRIFIRVNRSVVLSAGGFSHKP